MAHGFLGCFLALGLESPDLGHVLVHGALDALLIDGEELEVAGFLDPGAGLGERFVDLRVAGVGAAVGVEAHGEHAGFDGAGAIEAPAVVGDGLDQGALEIADGSEGFEDDFGVLLVGLLFARSEDEELSSESVAEGV